MLKLSELDPKLQARIQAEIGKEDAARAARVALGGLGAAHGKQGPSAALDKNPQEQPARRVRMVVSLIGVRNRALDDDNFQGACKPLRDAIAASIGIDDADPRVRWQYGEVETRGRQGVIVQIETDETKS